MILLVIYYNGQMAFMFHLMVNSMMILILFIWIMM